MLYPHVHYVFQFGIVADHIDELIQGALATLWLTTCGTVGGFLLAVFCVFLRSSGSKPVRWAIVSYVEVIRNTPFLVQLFILYFSLPAIGIRLYADQAAILGLSISFGGYATEILRSGIEAVPFGQVEAARSLGLRPFLIFRKIILFQAIKIAYPALASRDRHFAVGVEHCIGDIRNRADCDHQFAAVADVSCFRVLFRRSRNVFGDGHRCQRRSDFDLLGDFQAGPGHLT